MTSAEREEEEEYGDEEVIEDTQSDL